MNKDKFHTLLQNTLTMFSSDTDMTAEEVVQFLKMNKNTGIAFMCLSENIQDWIRDNFNNSNLLYLDLMGNWQYFEDADFDDYDNVVFALPDTFDLPPKPQTGWVEFEIDSNGEFAVDIDGDNKPIHYQWYEWGIILTHSKNSYSNTKYTAFGGWKYEGYNGWFNSPQFLIDGRHRSTELADEEQKAKPAIPIKIRFWREEK